MDMMNYMDIARMNGYEVRFTGIEMGYVVYGSVMLTDVLDIEKAEAQLALIGMAINNDDVRRMLQKG